MKDIKGTATLLRIFIGELDKYHHKPLYEAIVLLAKRHGLAGATVIRGLMSYGANSTIHTAKLFALSEDLPIIVEIIDEDEKIQQFVKQLEPYFESAKYGGLVTLEKINVIFYKNSKQ
jgi:PII-like signaling protein